MYFISLLFLLLFEFPSLQMSTGLTILNYMTFLSTMLLHWLRSVWQVCYDWLWVCVISNYVAIQFIRHSLVLWTSESEGRYQFQILSSSSTFPIWKCVIISCMYVCESYLLTCIRTLNNSMTLVLVWSWLVQEWCRWLTIVYHVLVARVSWPVLGGMLLVRLVRFQIEIL